jgi:hypothetical protein
VLERAKRPLPGARTAESATAWPGTIPPLADKAVRAPFVAASPCLIWMVKSSGQAGKPPHPFSRPPAAKSNGERNDAPPIYNGLAGSLGRGKFEARNSKQIPMRKIQNNGVPNPGAATPEQTPRAKGDPLFLDLFFTPRVVVRQSDIHQTRDGTIWKMRILNLFRIYAELLPKSAFEFRFLSRMRWPAWAHFHLPKRTLTASKERHTKGL